MVGIAVLAAVLVVFSRPRIPQDPAYHHFADGRPVLGIPNGLNVLSNFSFAVTGCVGLYRLRRGSKAGPAAGRGGLVWPLRAFFLGASLTAVGSSYYHLRPDDWRLVWDRLPMTLAFMGLLTSVIGDRVNIRAARLLFGPLLVSGACSVLAWYLTEVHGRGDLRPYSLVQFGSLLVVVLLIALYPGRERETRWLCLALASYAVAKVLEAADAPVLAATGIVSGHTLKHVLAAAGVACVAEMLRVRADGGSGDAEAPTRLRAERQPEERLLAVTGTRPGTG